jgi:hypothetical protein
MTLFRHGALILGYTVGPFFVFTTCLAVERSLQDRPLAEVEIPALFASVALGLFSFLRLETPRSAPERAGFYAFVVAMMLLAYDVFLCAFVFGDDYNL